MEMPVPFWAVTAGLFGAMIGSFLNVMIYRMPRESLSVSRPKRSFWRGDATAILGGCEIDLRGSASTGDSAVIEVFAFWGGIEIWVPDDWQVDVKGTAILASFEDQTRSVAGDVGKTLTVKGTAIMSGVEIKN